MSQRLPASPDLSDVFQVYPQAVRPLLEYHDILLRGDSPLSVAQRELIAAYVSGLNACSFCLGAHTIIAEAFGIPAQRIETLLHKPEDADVEPAMQVLLAYVEKLTRAPASLRPADRQAVFEAGWSERAVHDAVSVCALFNFMNRLVEGMGVTTSPAVKVAQRERHHGLPSPTPYQDYGRHICVLPSEGDPT